MAQAEHNIPATIPSGCVVLTKEGTMTERRFVLSGGSTGLFEGKRLGRAKNLEKLEKEVKRLDIKIQEQKSELDKLNTEIVRIKEHNYARIFEEKNAVYQTKLQELGILKSKDEEYRNFLESTGARSEDLLIEIERLVDEIQQLEPEMDSGKLQLEQAIIQSQLQKDALQNAGMQFNLVSDAYNRENVKLIELRNTVANLEKDIERHTENEARFTQNAGKLKVELEETKIEIQSLVEVNMQNDEEILELYQIKKSKEDITGIQEEKLNQTKSGIHQVEQQIRQERRQKEEIESQKEQIKENINKVRLELHTLKDRMEVEFGIQLSDLGDELLEGMPDDFNIDEMTKQVGKVRDKIHSFGEVNPMAVEAYTELKERYDFIQTQKADLVAARESLLATIQEIDTDAKTAFMDAFTRIRENFIRVFQTLFSEGDVCDLVLKNADDPLDSDIDIIAKPKGKRPLNINQLSGGEQTLTAISLLFAIYLLKPAPFCVFDEVDAPLDDANIDKFNNIIKEFSGNSQFIIVTHNKRTMISSHVIYGVTMQELGISKVLPVSLEALNLN
jgi:chromosome segregation protein